MKTFTLTLDEEDVKFILMLLDNELTMPLSKEGAFRVMNLITGINEAIEEQQ